MHWKLCAVAFVFLCGAVRPVTAAPKCGNGKAEFWERCDGADLKGWTCQKLKFQSGTLKCQPNCNVDVSGCIKASPVVKKVYCGDGLINQPSEECDITNLNNMTCAKLGPPYSGGTLKCNGYICKFNKSGCFVCGDGQHAPTEQCDFKQISQNYKAVIPQVSCTDFLDTKVVGMVGCDPTTCTFDFSKCVIPGDPYGSPPTPDTPSNITLPSTGCGNWIIDLGEVCDRLNLAGKTCEDFGFAMGKLTCSADCKSFVTTQCYGTPEDPYGPSPDPKYVPECGNGFLDKGEQCEPAPHPWKQLYLSSGYKSCSELGFFGGNIQSGSCYYGTTPVLCFSNNCEADCTFDTSGCYGAPGDPYGGTQHCGDGKLNPGEECDGPSTGPWGSCKAEGYYGGSKYCKACKITSSCYGWGSDPYGKPPAGGNTDPYGK